MTGDSGRRVPGRRGLPFRLPRVLEIEVRKSEVGPKELRNFKSALVLRDDAVDIVVRTDRPIPSRALGPALFVGSTALTEVDEVAPNTYRFTNFGHQELSEDAEIRLGWTGQAPVEAPRSKFRYRRPPDWRSKGQDEGDDPRGGSLPPKLVR
jgi:hypothetical protein